MSILYANPADFHDITSGASTGSPNYSAGTGYDYVTGMGSPIANLVVGSLVGTSSKSASATFLSTDTTTQGSWYPTYGNQGYNIIGNTSSYPSYATVTPAGNSSWTWAANTNVPQALVYAPGTNPSTRIAACWYASTSFTVDVNVTDGNTHDIELYLLDYDANNRSEQIQLSNANTHAVLDTETVSNFASGVYLKWAISGNVLITFTKQSGANAVVSGLFFDPSDAASLGDRDLCR